MIRVTIVSPNPALRIGLRQLLDDQPDISVIGEAATLGQLDEIQSEVVLMASVPITHLGEEDLGARAILLLTDNPEDARSLLKAQARAWGILSQNATGEELLAGVRAVGEGLWVGSAGLISDLVRHEGRVRLLDGETAVEPLTAREKEVLQLMAEGLANKQIALSLGISEHTVKFHLSSLYTKLNVSSRTEAVRSGLGLGLISL